VNATFIVTDRYCVNKFDEWYAMYLKHTVVVYGYARVSNLHVNYYTLTYTPCNIVTGEIALIYLHLHVIYFSMTMFFTMLNYDWYTADDILFI